VYEELQASVGYGYVFPQELFEKIRVLDVTPEEQRRYRNMLRRHMTLGKGELESVSVAVERGCLFSSLDKRAVKFAQKKRVTVVVLKVILKGLWKKGICTKKEVKELVDRIEKEDNRTIDTVGVFNE
ncbi:MAG: hypothetical protein U9M95_06760, partial [Candidatus Altiarchaeota archaeon]|nr:hypothetical protein [Candidatus Altiarchaeota archaeon]